jgi:hypothetical protein
VQNVESEYRVWDRIVTRVDSAHMNFKK